MVDIQLGKIVRTNIENQTVTIQSTFDFSQFFDIPLGNTCNFQTFPKIGSPVLFYNDTNGSTTRIIKVWDMDIQNNRKLVPGEVQIQSSKRALVYLDDYGNVQITDGSMQDSININNDDSLIETISKKISLTTIRKVKIEIDELGAINIVKYDPAGITELAKISIGADTSISIESKSTINVKGLNVNVEATSINLGGSIGARKLIDDRICTVFNSHVHMSGTGPTTPPIIPYQITSLPISPLQISVATQIVKGK